MKKNKKQNFKRFIDIQNILFQLTKMYFILFIIAMIISYFLIIHFHGDKIQNVMFRDSPFQNFNNFEEFKYILFNNSCIAVVLLLLGFGLLGDFISVAWVTLNAYALGEFLAVVQISSISPVKIFLVGILPHGLLEMYIFFKLAAIETYVSKKLKNKGGIAKNYRENKENFIICIKIFVFIVLPSLFAAAYIEAYITPIVIKYFLF